MKNTLTPLYVTKKYNYDENNYVSLNFSVLIENIIELDNNFTEKEKENLLNQLAKTHPWLEILSSLKIWDNYFQTIFTWIKEINDKHSQDFADILLNKSKETITQLFKNILKIENKIIWNDYKNFVLKFWKLNKKQIETLEQISIYLNEYLYHSYKEEIKNRKLKSCFNKDSFPLKITFKVSKIKSYEKEWKNEYESIIISLAKTRSELEKKSIWKQNWYIDFMNDWYKQEFIENLESEKIIIKNWNTREIHEIDKNQKIYTIQKNNETKIFQIFDQTNKNNELLSDEIYEYFINWKIPKILKLHHNITKTYYTFKRKDILEEEIIENWFKYSVDKKYLTITDTNSWLTEKFSLHNKEYWFYSLLLLERVRKNQLPKDLALYKKIKKLINIINIDWEFIFPEWENFHTDDYQDKISKYKKIKYLINTANNLEEIEKYLEQYYKWGLNIESFKKEVSRNIWTLIFFDIKNLWIYNIYSHYIELEKVLNWEQTIDDAKLNSWKLVTKIIKDLTEIDEIKKHPHTKWWDEWIIFHKNNLWDIKPIVEKIQTKAQELWIFCRITTAKKLYTHREHNILEELDLQTKNSKLLEKYFEKLEQRRIEISRYIYEKHKMLARNISDVIFTNEERKCNDSYLKERFAENLQILNTINKMKKLYLSFEEWEWIIVIWENRFRINETIDKNNNFIKWSDFVKFLDKNLVWRKK